MNAHSRANRPDHARRILVVDDSRAPFEMLKKDLSFADTSLNELHYTNNGRDALDFIRHTLPDAILLDQLWPDDWGEESGLLVPADQRWGPPEDIRRLQGLVILEAMQKENASIAWEIPVILQTGYSGHPAGKRALELGADYISKKGLKPQDVHTRLERGFLRREVLALRQIGPFQFDGTPMIRVMRRVIDAAASDSPVLLLGPTRTGKTELASLIYYLGNVLFQKNYTGFFRLGTLSDTLAPAELHGHDKGIFTGAHKERKGILKSAQGGVLFADDVDTFPHGVQKVLLDVFEGRRRRVGDEHTEHVQVRVICATNKSVDDLRQLGFGEDLILRFKHHTIAIPSLSQSGMEYISRLVEFYLDRACKELGQRRVEVAGEAREYLYAYPWPGNVYQLKWALHHAVARAGGARLELGDIMDALTEHGSGPAGPQRHDEAFQMSLKDYKERREREYWEYWVKLARERNWSANRLFKELGVDAGDGYEKLRRYDGKDLIRPTKSREGPVHE